MGKSTKPKGATSYKETAFGILPRSKIIPIERFIAAGFCGSIKVGFKLIEDLKRYAQLPDQGVAWVGDPEAQQAFKAYQSNLKTLLDEVNWPFEITEVVLYGADSTKQPEYQEKLIPLIVK